MIEVHPEGAFCIGEVLADAIHDLQVDAVGGLATGAIPMVTSAVVACFHRKQRVEGFWVRGQAKAHGTRKSIEGDLQSGSRVLIVDDVVTSGKSVIKAIDAVEAHDCKIVAVVCLVDRDRGARELLEGKGYTYQPIFTKSDILSP